MSLTVKGIAKLTKPGRFRDERGLYLQVMSPTNRSWLLRYERDGRERWMGLGRCTPSIWMRRVTGRGRRGSS